MNASEIIEDPTAASRTGDAAGTDAARAKQAAIDVERTERLRDAFLQEHPRLRDAAIVPVKKGEFWLITLDEGVTFKATWVSSEKCAFARCHSETYELLEGPVVVRLRPAPELPPASTLVAVALAYEERCSEMLGRVRNAVGNWEQAVEVHAEPTAEVFRVRFRDAFPGTVPSVKDKDTRLANLDGLRDGARELATVAGFLRTVPEQAAAARRLGLDATRAIETALASLRRPVARKTARLAGEPDAVMQTAEEQRLLKLQAEVVDKLMAAVGELVPTVEGLQDTTPLFLSAGLQALREGYIEAVTAIQQATTIELRRLQTWQPERDATEVIAMLAKETGQAIITAGIIWSKDPLEPPRLG